MHRTGCTSGCAGAPLPVPLPLLRPPPPGSHAPSCLSPRARGALALALGSLPGPHASVPLSVPWVPPPVTRALACTAGARARPVPVPMPLAAPMLAHRPSLRSMRSVATCLGARPAPLRALPAPRPLPGSLPRVAPSAARALSPSAAAGLGASSVFAPLLLAACALARPLRVPLGTPPVASCPPLRALPWLALCPACAPSCPSWITRRASRCLCSCGNVTPGGESSGAGRRTCRVRPEGKGLRGGGLGGLVWVWVGLVWARYFAPYLPTAAAAAAPGEAPGARAGSVPCVCGVPGAAASPAEAVARLAGAAVSTPRAPSPPPSAAAAAPCDAPGSCAGATHIAGGAPGAAVGAAARLAGAAVSAPRAPGAPSRGGAAGLAAWAAGAVSSAGSVPWVDGPVSAEAARGCPAGGPTDTAASTSLCSSPSAGVSPADSGETGERERDRRWWRSSRWGEPSESDVSVFLVGMRRGRCALPTTSRCICVVPWAVLCSFREGEGGRGWGASGGISPVRAGAGGHPSAFGGEAGKPRGQRVAPKLPVWGRAQGPGPPGVVGWCRGEPH